MTLACRQATFADAPGIAELGEEMRRILAPNDANFSGTEEHREKVFRFLLDKGFLGVVINDGVHIGLLGAAPVEVWWSPKTFAVQECMFWIASEGRRLGAATLLLAELERWARGRGFGRIYMTSEGDYNFHVMKKFYLSRGYRRSMTTYAKDLANG